MVYLTLNPSHVRVLYIYIYVDSVPTLGAYYFLSLTLSVSVSVCPSVTEELQIDSSFSFLNGIEPFLGHQFSMTKLQNVDF